MFYLVEWVRKSFWVYLNKLFEIDPAKRKFSIILIEKIFKSVLDQSYPFVILIFSQLALTFPLSDEHFLINDLKFYQVAQVTKNEMRQAYLNTL